MNKKHVGAFDPGLNGGIAILDLNGNICELLPMPILKIKSKNGSKSEYDLRKILSILKKYEFKMFGIESQQAFPAQGSVSTFRIGRGFGLLEGIICALDIPYTLVKPQGWQKSIFAGLPPDDTKSLSVMVAQRIWPKQDFRRTPRCDNPHDGCTDASLIAEYIRRELT